MILLSACLSMACMKDKGSYGYTSISEITVKRPGEGAIVLKKDVPDTLRPLIDYGKKEGAVVDTAAYQYYWYVWAKGRSSTDIDYQLLSNNKPYLTAATLTEAGYDGLLPVKFEVREKATGITASITLSLLMMENATECWVLLYEKNGNSKLGILAYNTSGYTPFMNISDSLGLAPYLTGNPVSLAQMTHEYQGPDSYVGVSTDQTVFLLNKAFGPAQGVSTATSISKVLHSSPEQPVYLLEGSPGACWQNGNIYRIQPSLDVGESPLRSTTPINIRSSPADSYKVSPVGLGDDGGIIFDETHGRFMDFSWWMPPTPIVFNPAYDLKGYKLLYLRSLFYQGVGRMVGAVVKNDANEFYLVMFLQNGVLKSVTKITDKRVAEARHFVIDFSTGYLLFDAPHAILGYDYNTNESIELMDLGVESVSVMKYQIDFFGNVDHPRKKIYDDITRKLVVCTYDPGKASEQAGTFRLMNVPLGRQPLQESYKMTGLPVIRDITFNGYPNF